MSKELVIGSNRHETKVAILEDDQLAEIYFQRTNEYSLAGSIHKGKVTRVLPGMQSAFVDLGLERDTFLYVSDFFEENEDIDTVTDEKPAGDRRERGSRQPPRNTAPPESEPVRENAPEALVSDVPPESAPSAPVTADVGSERANGDRQQTTDRPGGGDRNFRGDRRGRRSRRRRSHGSGFPENKYAQPASHSAGPPPAEASVTEEDEKAPDSQARDVIILPGESLAKYRHLAPGRESDVQDTPADESRRPDAEIEPHEEQEIAAEAQEIELTDRVFSNHPESPAEKEEKLAEVRQDQPASPFLVDDLDEPDEEDVPVEHASAPAVLVADSAELSAAPGAVTAETEVVEEAEEPELLDSEPFDPEDTIEPDEDIPERHELVALFEEEGEQERSVPETEANEAEAPQAQTASVREGGGRYMHRVSRRMRRRRGNRGNQDTAFEPRTASSGGAAAGMQPETRAESEEKSAERPDRALPSISELLKPGQEIIVQIAKEPLGTKGARITSHIALPGRYVVFMPSVNHVGVSRKIASDEERQRLKRILQQHRVGAAGGFIVRTAGEGVPEEEIAADMDFLYRLWMDIREKAEKRPAPALLHYDLDVVQRILRDQVTEEFKSIWVDNEDMYENVLSFMQRFQPALVSRVKMYTRSAPIFDAFGITQELEKALRPKVWLKSGGYIVINQTEALVAIDINTGKYVGKSNRLEDTIVKTNTEAVKEIVRQIRLRDLGGIIVVDFIDMDERKNRQKVMQALEEAMRADRAPYKILQFNDFGLVAITRKRVKQSLERTLCSPCPYCEGAGYVKSVQTVIGEILVESQKLAKAIEGKDVLLRVHPEVAKVLKANDNRFLEEIEESLAKPVLVKGDPALHIEKFDLG